MTRCIDAHQHFWKLARGDYRWLTSELGPLYRDFGPRDLAPKLRAHGIASTVLVQAADSLAESQFLLALADANEFVAGVVAWIDFDALDASDQLAALALHPKIVGVRPMIQDIADDTWMLRPELARVFERIAELDLAFDALVKPRHLAHVHELVARHPALKVVVDHAGKPDVASGLHSLGFARWVEDMRRLARHPNVHCKMSGLVTEASANWTVATLAPYVAVLLEHFGAQRLMWGSDWPVVELAGGYDAWRRASEELLGSLRSDERAAVFGGNAQTFYGLSGSMSS
ncbi:MAG: amidohydrolase family protein [Planctomycetes bacterium]|nr:amidohydrolase family protein [Planctomycetota bacterium]